MESPLVNTGQAREDGTEDPITAYRPNEVPSISRLQRGEPRGVSELRGVESLSIADE